MVVEPRHKDIMTTFISYASEYDLYRGEKDIDALVSEEQDELIRFILEPDKDFRELVVRKDVKKSQAEGLWSLVVFVGLALEGTNRISDFDGRTEKDIQEIIAFFSGTKLWLRLEEAYPPFDFLSKRTNYSWGELEKIRMEALTEATGEPLYKIKSKICEFLSSAPSQLQSEVIDRMPYHAFKQTYDEGKLILFTDKGLSTIVGRSRLIKSPVPTVLALVFSGTLLAFIPIGIFVGLWYGVATLVLAVVSKKLTTRFLVQETRRLALSDKEIYRWLLARRIIWVQYI